MFAYGAVSELEEELSELEDELLSELEEELLSEL